MSALPPDEMRKLQQSAFAARHPVDSMLARWDSIEREAAMLARVAGLDDERQSKSRANTLMSTRANTQANLAELLVCAADWQRELAWQAVEDIGAMLDAGMAALDVLAARGKDARIPALALWREVDAARRSVIAVLDAHGKTAVAPAA